MLQKGTTRVPKEPATSVSQRPCRGRLYIGNNILRMRTHAYSACAHAYMLRIQTHACYICTHACYESTRMLTIYASVYMLSTGKLAAARGRVRREQTYACNACMHANIHAYCTICKSLCTYMYLCMHAFARVHVGLHACLSPGVRKCMHAHLGGAT